MFDRLLGRSRLRERIEELEDQLQACRDEREALEERYEAANRRETEAISDYQGAREQLNRAEDRIQQLEDRIDQLSGEDDELEFRETKTLRGDRLSAVLDRLDSVRAPPDSALTAVIEADVPSEVREVFGQSAPLLQRASPCLALTDTEGIVRVALRPPVLPDVTVSWSESFDFDRSWFLPTGSFSLALVRADLFVFGEYQGETRLSMDSFQSDVGENHSKGGFSQGRFERRRDEVIDEHLTRCETFIREQSPDRLILAGDSAAVDALDVEAVTRVPVDASGEPEAALEAAFRDVWTTRLYRL
jgi:peptide subunit release factor 1 (eRF1)